MRVADTIDANTTCNLDGRGRGPLRPRRGVTLSGNRERLQFTGTSVAIERERSHREVADYAERVAPRWEAVKSDHRGLLSQ